MRTSNAIFDHVVRPEVHLLGRRIRAFVFFGYVGALSAFVLVLALATRLALSLRVSVLLSLLAVLTYAGLASLTLKRRGELRLAYYHYFLSTLVVWMAVLFALREPIASYLDVMALGYGTFLVVVRLGCLMAGCCHGRPHTWGVSYGKRHVEHGFKSSFVGVRLLPIQLIESTYVLIIVLVGVTILLRGSMPGEALALYVVLYSTGRFAFEFFRGDANRPYFAGFSEPQWISMGLVSAAAAAALWYGLELRYLYVALAMVVTVSVLGVTLLRLGLRTNEHLL